MFSCLVFIASAHFLNWNVTFSCVITLQNLVSGPRIKPAGFHLNDGHTEPVKTMECLEQVLVGYFD